MTDDLRIGSDFFKAHGLGNDYLVFRQGRALAVTPGSVTAICDRWRGVGADGIVVLLGTDAEPSPPFRLRMFNPDGSEFERSGNGLRVFASYVYERGLVGSEPFVARVGGDEVTLRVHGTDATGALDVSVEMGRTLHGPEAVALDPSVLDDGGRLDLGPAGRVALVPVSVGNPHAVVFDEAIEDERLAEVGPALCTHPAFANGTNVQLARVDADTVVQARIFERGVGVTASSGTSACAVAAAAVRTGRVPAGEIEVRMPGGSMWVRVDEDFRVTLRGPVENVCTGRLSAGFLRHF